VSAWRGWTPEEDRILRTGGACLRPWAEVAAELGRPVRACASRAQRLRSAGGHLEPVRCWTPAEDAIALDVRPYALAASLLGRTEIAVRMRSKKLRRRVTP